MTTDQLAELEALEKAATKRPWHQDAVKRFGDAFVHDADDESICCCGVEAQDDANAAFIAAIRNAAPELIATVREQRKEIERTQKKCSDARDMMATWLYNLHNGTADCSPATISNCLERLSNGLYIPQKERDL
jgi:hypothetical protein